MKICLSKVFVVNTFCRHTREALFCLIENSINFLLNEVWLKVNLCITIDCVGDGRTQPFVSSFDISFLDVFT